MESDSGFYAHTPGQGSEWHDLVLHLTRTAAKARYNAAKFGAGEVGYLAGLWHDLGKFNPEFQEYLVRCESADRNGARGRYRTRIDKRFCTRNCKEKWRYHNKKPRRAGKG